MRGMAWSNIPGRRSLSSAQIRSTEASTGAIAGVVLQPLWVDRATAEGGDDVTGYLGVAAVMRM